MDGVNNEIDWQSLYRAVLLQAVKDAFRIQTSLAYKQSALDFLNGGQDLEFACDVAGVSYDGILSCMKCLSNNNNQNYRKLVGEIKNKKR